MPVTDKALKPQTKLGDYAIKRVLGRGAFGITYLAERVGKHVAVAIKEYFPDEFAERDSDGTTVNPSRPSDSPGQDFQSGLDKFLEESRVLGSFRSPHIVQVVDTFELNGTAYMVMQYEEGGTLARYLHAHQTPMEEGRILSIFVPILEGLRSIHAKWLLHRDIKPENIYIRKGGSPLLIDFGTARHALSVKHGGMTEYLTPGFAPPEQYDRHADHGPWTDIYAVGATMYYCVTRITPAEGRFRSVDNDPVMPALQAAPKFYDEHLLKVIDWMMMPDANSRPQSVEEVLERLQPLEDGEAQAIDEGRDELAKSVGGTERVAESREPRQEPASQETKEIEGDARRRAGVDKPKRETVAGDVSETEKLVTEGPAVDQISPSPAPEEPSRTPTSHGLTVGTMLGIGVTVAVFIALTVGLYRFPNVGVSWLQPLYESRKLSTCQSYLDSNQLTAGDANAFDCYQQLLAENPANTKALLGLVQIEDKLISWARSAIGENRGRGAQLYLNKLKQIKPNHKSIAELQDAIDDLHGTRESSRQDKVASVKQAQKQLSTLGYYTGAIDGILGPNTREAVGYFQREWDASISGDRIERALLSELEKAVRITRNRVKALGGECKRLFARWLNETRPKGAFAVASYGGCGDASSVDSLRNARRRALDECSKHGPGCRVVDTKS